MTCLSEEDRMFVVYRVKIADGVKFERVEEFHTLEEASEFLEEHKNDEDRYTVMME